MPAAEKVCCICRSAISRSDFRYRISQPGQPDRSLCSPCVTRCGLDDYREALIVMPEDLSPSQGALLCDCPECRIDGAPLEIAEREATALARRMLQEMRQRHDAGDTAGAQLRADTLAVLACSGVRLDLHGDDREVAYAAEPYQTFRQTRTDDPHAE